MVNKLIAFVFSAAFATGATANQFLLITKSDGSMSTQEIIDQPDCQAIFFTGRGWTGQRTAENGWNVDATSTINLSEVTAIRQDGSASGFSDGYVVETKDGRRLPAAYGNAIVYAKVDESNNLDCPKKDLAKSKSGTTYTGKKLSLLVPLRGVFIERIDVFSDQSALESEMASRTQRQEIARKEAQDFEERKRRNAAEREAAERKFAAAQEIRERKLAAEREAAAKNFRRSLAIGKDTHCGMIIEKNGPIVKVQTVAGEKWLKIAQIYPPGDHSCRFVNGQYVD